jgi:hypothetical protein
LQACAVTLRRCLEPEFGRSKYVTESHVHKILFLIGLGLREAEADGEAQFRGRAEAASIWTLLDR